jgi:hypothetical protein
MDIVTNLMSTSLPFPSRLVQSTDRTLVVTTIIILIRNSRPLRYQALCLPLIVTFTAMLVTISLIRITPLPGPISALEDSIWQTFWVYIESCTTLTVILGALLWKSMEEFSGMRRMDDRSETGGGRWAGRGERRRMSVRTSRSSIKKEDIGVPVFVQGTSEWVASSVWDRYVYPGQKCAKIHCCASGTVLTNADMSRG